MPQVEAYSELPPTFGNQSEIVRKIYDFAKDGGAVGVYDLLKASDDMVVISGYAKVITAATSGGSMTMDLGIKAGDTDALIAAEAVAGLTAGALVKFIDANMPLKVSAAAVLSMEVAVAALTAGKIEFVFEVQKF